MKGALEPRKPDKVTPASLTIEIALASNVLLAVIALFLLGLALLFANFWEQSSYWRAVPFNPTFQPWLEP